MATDRLSTLQDDVQYTESTQTQAESPLFTDNGILAAERALLSLERICARFSSGSLGSLGSIAGDTTNHIQTFGSALTTVPSVGDRESLATSCRLPDTITSPSAQVSCLPTLKHRQVESVIETKDIATANDSSDNTKSGSLHATRVDGSSHVAAEDVPSDGQQQISDGTHQPAKSAPLSPRNTLIPSPRCRRGPALAPLASHVLKREIAERSQGLHPRLVFGKTKLGDKENRLPPVKTLRKKKGMVFAERMEPAAELERPGRVRAPARTPPSLIPVFLSRSAPVGSDASRGGVGY